MAINTGKGGRKGAVIERSQTYNPKTEKYVKRDAKTGKFMASKDSPFKGVKKEKSASRQAKPKDKSRGKKK